MTITTASSPTGHKDASTDVPIEGTDLYLDDGLLYIGALAAYPELLHAITTRRAPDGTDWNLSAKRGTPENPPDPAIALRNREKLAATLGISLDRMVGVRQVHGTLVASVGMEDAGRGMRPEHLSIEGADAMVTDVPGLYLMVLSADCPPVFFYDPVRRVVGLAHSGWKGTVGRIAANVVELMVDDYGSDPDDIVAAVGPGIGPCCYKVGDNVIELAQSAFLAAWQGDTPILQRRDGHTYFNLRETIRRTLLDSGLSPQNISVEEICTAHNLDLFYSHRGEAGQCGLFGAVLGLRKK